jgi:hypothetical protein
MSSMTKELRERAIRCLVRLCLPCLIWVHAARFRALLTAVGALLGGQRLVLTKLGRAIGGPVAHKHNIKRIDRLLGNPYLQQEQLLFYGAMAHRVGCQPLRAGDGSCSP